MEASCVLRMQVSKYHNLLSMDKGNTDARVAGFLGGWGTVFRVLCSVRRRTQQFKRAKMQSSNKNLFE
jgi:hypothetical protein